MLSPRPGALADLLGGEERLEHLVPHLRRHAGAGVADRKHHIGAGPHVGIGLRVGFVEHDVARLEQQLAAVRHRVAGVDRHVEQRSSRAARRRYGRPPLPARGSSSISICSPSVGRSSLAISSTVPLMSTLRGCSGWRRAKASRCWISSLQRSAAWSISLGGLRQLRLVLEARDQRFGGAGDHGQHVVEVVRDAAGELADGVQFLRLQQLVLGFARSAVMSW